MPFVLFLFEYCDVTLGSVGVVVVRVMSSLRDEDLSCDTQPYQNTQTHHNESEHTIMTDNTSWSVCV